MKERAGEYLLLSRLLASPPDAKTLKDVQTLGWIKTEPDVETLQIEFTRLFSIPGPDAISPHQSVYTDVLQGDFPTEHKGYLGGKSCSQVKHWYEAAHFKPQDPAPAMADHIATQLAFLAHLSLAEARAREAQEQEEVHALKEVHHEFYMHFLSKWIKTLGEKLVANTVSEFYRCVGHHMLTTQFDPMKHLTKREEI